MKILGSEIRGVLLGASAALGVSAASAQTYSALQTGLYQFYTQTRDYNLVLAGNYTREGSGQDVEGGAAIGGSLNLGGKIPFMGNPGTATKGFGGIGSGGDPDFVLYGAMNINGAIDPMVMNGGTAAINLAATSGATWNSGDNRVNTSTGFASIPGQGGVNPQTTFNSFSATWNLNTAINSLKNSSVALKGYSNQNVTSGSNTNTLALTVGANQIGVWNITQAQLNSIGQIDLNVPSTSILVINVHGAGTGTAQFPSANTIGGTSSSGSRVLWNITSTAQGGNEAAAANFAYKIGNGGNTTFGSFLMPKANVDAQMVIEGQVVANSWNQGNVELHQELFIINTSLVPEPSTWAMLLGSGCLAFAWWFRRRRA